MLKINILSILLILLTCNLRAGEKLDFSISNDHFINFMESFIDSPVKKLLDSLIVNGYYYDYAEEETDHYTSLIGWKLFFKNKNIAIILIVNKFSYVDPWLPKSFNYPGNNFDFITFQKETISQILIRQNISANPRIENYYKWVSLPRETKKKNKTKK